MTDDSNTEKQTLKTTWPDSQQLFCTFHFLQRRWTWLFDGHNKIQHKDRTTLLNTVIAMVYAKTVSELEQKYKEFKTHLTVQNILHLCSTFLTCGLVVISGHFVTDLDYQYGGITQTTYLKQVFVYSKKVFQSS